MGTFERFGIGFRKWDNIQIKVSDSLSAPFGLKLIAQNKFGCQSIIDSNTMLYNFLPVPTFKQVEFWICPKETEAKSYSVLGKKGSTFSWTVEGAESSMKNDSSISDVWNPIASEFVIEVTETDAFGCVSQSLKKEIRFDSQLNQTGSPCSRSKYPLLIPNLISPNGDGKNEFFEILNMEYYPKTRLSIVNRWGKEIYSTANYNQEFSFKNYGEGIYFYMINTDDGHQINGYIQVVK